MSKVSSFVKKQNAEKNLRLNETEKNFMGGDSYKVNPLLKMQMITASSIFGEPQYYYNNGISKTASVKNKVQSKYYNTLLFAENNGKTTAQIMEEAIDEALNYDFIKTVNWADTLRNEYNMRFNPQIIMVRAAIHPKRKEIQKKLKSNWFRRINANSIMKRADEPAMQLAYYLFLNNGKKNCIPSVLKRSWGERLERATSYEIEKYKNAEIGMINTVRICHANKGLIPVLMANGKVPVKENEKTWERLRSDGYSWQYVIRHTYLPHMAMLRNIRNIFKEEDFKEFAENDTEFAKKYMEKLKEGVPTGKQFPFRYWSAMKAINADWDVKHKRILRDGLEECMDIATENMPKLKGKTMCLSDNSGSAWGAFTSEYGSVTVAEIDNLSSVITAVNSDEGYIGKFGDRLKVIPASKRNGILSQAQNITAGHYEDVGGRTEGGIWEFFAKAISTKEHWDNIFIYSDMQAGHGGLYGTEKQIEQYRKLGYDDPKNPGHINVYQLIEDYRKKVNPKVNVFCVQTAGYGNALVPEYAYRTNILYGWTGKELVFADLMNKLWDEYDEEVLSQNINQIN